MRGPWISIPRTLVTKSHFNHGFTKTSSLCQLRLASSLPPRQWSTPLAKTIADVIEAKGPISIADYMRQCLTAPDSGYYTRAKVSGEKKDQFGQKGDFVTSPEISQIFGELVAIWTIAEWMSQGRSDCGIRLIEAGPGRGTLMDDVLRTFSRFPEFYSKIQEICLIEASPALRAAQRDLLCQDSSEIKEGSDSGIISKYSDIPITWHHDLKDISEKPSLTHFIYAHEFFDALPIHAFQRKAPSKAEQTTIATPTGPIALGSSQRATSRQLQPQWRELMVVPVPAPTSSIMIPPSPSRTQMAGPKPDFQLTLSRTTTPHSSLLPQRSERYKAMLTQPDAVIEISEQAQIYAEEMAKRVGSDSGMVSNLLKPKDSSTSATSHPQSSKNCASPGGAALIIDYGPSHTIPTSSLRGIRAHQHVSPFVTPGSVDLSADVDFVALAESACKASSDIEVHGPVEQGAWLTAMGIRARADVICQNLIAKGDLDGPKRIMASVERLVERGGGAMGKVYKVMALVPERGGRPPVGFGGTLE